METHGIYKIKNDTNIIKIGEYVFCPKQGCNYQKDIPWKKPIEHKQKWYPRRKFNNQPRRQWHNKKYNNYRNNNL